MKWLEEDVVVMSLSDGTLQVKDIRENDTANCGLLHRTDCAIWDVALNVQSATGNQIIIAEDSGKVKCIDPRNGSDSILLTGFH